MNTSDLRGSLTRNPRFQSGFTLIELLTVIAIIAILMALLFPVIGAIKDQANKTKASADLQASVTAVKNYDTEYGKLPALNTGAAAAAPVGDTAVGDPSVATVIGDNVLLFATLRNKADPSGTIDISKTNPRGVVCMEGRTVANATTPKSGFLDQTGGTGKRGCFYDPWGTQYVMVLDTDNDNSLDLSKIYTADYTDKSTYPQGTAVGFSLGKDHQVASPAKGLNGRYRNGTTISDDVCSWQ